MYSVVLLAVSAIPNQGCGPHVGGYPPVSSHYWQGWQPPCIVLPPMMAWALEAEEKAKKDKEESDKKFKEVDKKLKATDQRLLKVEKALKKIGPAFKDLQKSTEERIKDLHKNTDERIKDLHKSTDERIKDLDQRQDKRFKALETKQEDRLKALDTRWEERFRTQEERARALELKLLEDRVLQGLKKLEDRMAEAERAKVLEGKIDDKMRQGLEPLAKGLRALAEQIRQVEASAGQNVVRNLEQKLEVLELRLKGKVDVFDERLKGVDKLAEQIRKVETDRQGIDKLEERIRKLESENQDLKKLQERLQKLEKEKKKKAPKMEEAVVASLTRPLLTAAPGKALLVIHLPADAVLYVEGRRAETSNQTVRYIQTPALEEGAGYFYVVRVDVVRNGKTVSETQRVHFRAGQEIRVSFEHLKGPEAHYRTVSAP